MSAEHPLTKRLYRPSASPTTTVLVYGENGVGKTSFGKASPDPFFIRAEPRDLPKHIPAVTPTSWSDTLSIIEELIKDPMGRRSFVVDTVDWLEPKIIQHVCERDNDSCKGKLITSDGRPYIEGYGFNGPAVLVAEWQLFLSALERLRSEQAMNIVLLGHAGTYRHKNPKGDDYDVIGPKLERKSAHLLCEWPETVLYAEFWSEVLRPADISKKNSKAKVRVSGDRVCWTTNENAHRAKNCSAMPSQIDLSWKEFAHYALADISALRAAIDQKLAALANDDLSKKVLDYIADGRGEAGVLYKAIERLDSLLAKTQTESKG